MSIPEIIERKTKDFARTKIDEKLGNTDVTIASLSDLKKELNIGNLDTTKLEAIFKEFKTSKEKLKTLQASLLGTDEEKLKKLEEFILDKTKINTEAADKAKDLQKKLAVGAVGVAGVAGLTTAGLKAGLDTKMSEIKDAEGMEKFGKMGELFEWFTSSFDTLKVYIATKSPTLAKWFGWDKEIADVEAAKDLAKKGEAVVAGAVGVGKEAVAKGAEELKTDAEAVKKNFDKKKESVMRDIQERWGIDFNNQKTSQKSFDAIWDKYASKMTNDTQRVGRLAKPETEDNLVSVFNAFGKDSMEFVLDLVRGGFIGLDALRIELSIAKDQMISFAIASGKSIAGLAGSGFEEIMGDISITEFKETYSKLSPEKQGMLAHIIDRKGAFVLQLAGLVGQMITTAFVMYPTFDEGVKITEYWGMKRNNLLGNFEKQAAGFEELLGITGKSMGKDIDRLRSILIESNTKTLVTGAYMNAKDTAGFYAELENIKTMGNVHGKIGMPAVDQKFIANIEAFKGSNLPIKEIGTKLQTELRSGGDIYTKLVTGGKEVRAWLNTKFWKGNLSEPNFHIDNLARESLAYQEGLAEQVGLKGTLLHAKWAKFKQWFKIGEIPGASQKATLSVNQSNINEVKGTLSLLIKESPELVKGLFRNAAILITLTGSIAAGQKNEDVLGSVTKGLFGLVPFVGPIYIMNEGFNWKGGALSNPGYIVTAGGMLAFDSYEFYKILMGNNKLWNIGKFAFRPVVMTGELLGGIGQTINATWAGVSGLTKAIKNKNTAELLVFGKKWGVNLAFTIGLAIIASVAYKAYDKKSEENMIVKMKEDGYIDENGNLVEEKIKEMVSKLEFEEKRFIAKELCNTAISGFDKPGSSARTLDFEIRSTMSPAKLKVVFDDLGTNVDQTNIAGLFEKFGLVADFKYTRHAMREYAKEYKKSGFAVSHFKEHMKQLGISDDVEPYYS